MTLGFLNIGHSNIDLQLDQRGLVQRASTSSLDGKLIFWDLKTVLSDHEMSKMLV